MELKLKWNYGTIHSKDGSEFFEKIKRNKMVFCSFFLNVGWRWGEWWKEMKSPKLGCYKSLKTIQATGWTMWRGLSLTEPVHCHPPSHPPRSSRQHLRSPCESRQPISWTSVALTLAFQELFWLHEKEAGWRTNHDEAWQDLGDWPLSFTTLSKVPQTQKAYQGQPGFSHFPDIRLEDRGGGDLTQGWCSISANLTILPSPWSKEHKRSHCKFLWIFTHTGFLVVTEEETDQVAQHTVWLP